MPLSNAAGSAQDLTWTVVLPTDRAHEVADLGPTFWFGGTVTDPSSLFGQSFVELQFYPDGILTNCTPNGGFELKHVPNTYTVCSPVWSIHATGQKPNYHEPAAFNAMLVDSTGTGPLVMHAGDTVTIHWFVTSAQDGFHVPDQGRHVRRRERCEAVRHGERLRRPRRDRPVLRRRELRLAVLHLPVVQRSGRAASTTG